MENRPRGKIWPHLMRKAARYPDDAPASGGAPRGRLRLRRLLAGAALLVALFAIVPVLERSREAGAPRGDGAAKVTACDRLAAHPSDTQKLAPGIAQENVDIAKGKAACIEALKKAPNDPRLLYQLGRMYFYNKEYETGIGFMRRSAAGGYPQGAFVLGLILVQGNGTEPDACEGGRLWVKAARQRHLYSKIYLASNWRDGLFKDCALDVTDAEIGSMLTAAEDLVENARERDDLEQAKANWAKP
jgi:TPR repeat protein